MQLHLPAGVHFISFGAASGSVVFDGCTSDGVIHVSCTLASLPAGGTTAIVVNGAATAVGSQTISGAASSATPDPNPINNSATATTVVVAPSADLALTLTATSGPIHPGDGVVYNATIGNLGPDAAQQVTLHLTLPAGVHFISFGAASGSVVFDGCTSDGIAHADCTLSSLPAGGTTAIVVNGAATAVGSQTISGAASSTTPDPVSSNNSAAASTSVIDFSADLAVTKTGPAGADAGTDVSYHVLVANHGPDTATNVQTTDVVPAGMSFVNFSYDPGVAPTGCNLGATVSCSIPTMAKGAVLGFTLVLHVSATTPDGTVITNTASATRDQADPTLADDSASVSTTVHNRVVVLAAGVSSVEGGLFSGSVALVSGGIGRPITTIDWGDGSPVEAGSLVPNPAGGYFVTGTHAYSEEGSFVIHVSATDGQTSSSADSPAAVADAPLIATGGSLVSVEGSTFAGVVATFTDADPNGTVSDYSTTINWGDGTTTPGTVTASTGGFQVSGSHAYAEEGLFRVAVATNDAGGSAATAAATASVADAAIHAHGLTLGATRSTMFNGIVVTFFDDDAGGMIGDYSVLVNWGDGTSSGAIVSAAAGGGFAGSAQHTFGEGRFNIVSTITDAGGATASATTTITVDLTPPTTTATVTGTLGTNGWWKSGSPTLLTLAAADDLSGVAATYFRQDGGAAILYSGSIRLADGVHTVQYWSIDGVGNLEAVNTIVVKVDHGLPAVIIHGVADGHRYMLGAVPTPTFTASDPGSSIASSSSTLTPPGTASGVGVYTFSATATDVAGNATTVTIHYTVNYVFAFISPLPPDPSVGIGRTLAVRIQLSDINGNPVANGVARLLVDGAAATPSGTFNTGNLFRYQPRSQQYLYRLSTTGLAPGQHLLTVVLDDGTMREESFSIGASAPFRLTALPTSILVGQSVAVSGVHYAPRTTVTIRFNGLVVGHATAGAAGTFTISVTIPSTAPLGNGSLVAAGVAVGGAAQLESRLVQLTG